MADLPEIDALLARVCHGVMTKDASEALRALRAEVERQSATISDLTRERDAAREALAPAAADVLAERRRQVIEEGWTIEHDNALGQGQMAGAAACYALYRSHVPPEELMGEGILDMSWPWDGAWWKPTSRRRDLVKAGALILAEIERLDRMEISNAG